MARNALFVLCFGLGLGLSTPAAAQRYQIPIGPRPIGMGGAFSAIADDYSAIFWNPAGLVRIRHQEIAGNHSKPFGIDLTDSYLAFVLPLSPNHALATDWWHSGTDDPELDVGENRIDLVYSTMLRPRLGLGVGAKLLTRNTANDVITVRDGTGFGLDVGLLAGPVDGLQVGVVAQDLFDTELKYNDGNGNATAYPMAFRAGASYAYRDWGHVAFDVDDRFHFGVEALPVDLLALRAGYQRSTDGSQGGIWSFGAGFKVNIFRFDYAYETHPDLDGTSMFGLTLAFNFNPAQIRIEQVETRELYSSLYKSYDRSSIGTVRVRNLRDEPLNARLSVFIPGIMDAPSEREVLLRPGATQDVPLIVVFSDRVMEQDEDRTFPVEVSASYRSARVMRTDKSSAKAVVYSPGAINWGDGVDQAAAFITPRDPVVAAVAREAGRTVAGDLKSEFPNRNIAFCAAMMNAMDVIGIAYVPDPNNPFSTISETEHAVDVVHYPRETLERRAGDCDDLSVLLCSLLGNVGVPTMLVDAPGHLMILADTGMHKNQARGLAVDEYLYTIVDDEIWIPIETTALGKSFCEAWSQGARAYQDWDARSRISLVDVGLAQQRYEPALPSGKGSAPNLDTEELIRRVTADGGEVETWRREYLDARYHEVETPTSRNSMGLNQVAFAYFTAGSYPAAESTLLEALDLDSGSSITNNNLAAVYLRQGRGDLAIDHLETARKLDPADPGIQLNLGIARMMMGNRESGRTVTAAAVEGAGGTRNAGVLLRSPGLGNTTEEAVDTLERLAGSEPGTVPAYWKH